MADVDWIGLVVLIVFYVLILVFGIVAARCFRPKDASDTEVSMVAGRQLSLGVGIATMAATYMGGGFLNGLAEGVQIVGVLWVPVPLGIMVGVIIAAFAFGGPMRRRKCLTFLDPFHEQYGREVTAVLFLATLLADIFWSASILAALGTSLSVIIKLDRIISIVISAAVAVTYTMLGQMVAVAYTDILELFFLVAGLGIAIPFAATNDAVDLEASSQWPPIWLGEIPPILAGAWVDFFALTSLGAIPWQSTFQRFLSTKSVRDTYIIAVVGGIIVFIMGLGGSLTVGIIGKSTDWNQTAIGNATVDPAMILPLVMYYLTPRPVAIIGLAAVAAAVMSSVDSAILGSSSMFSHNIYRALIRKKASEREVLWVSRVAIFIIGGASMVLAIFSDSIFGLVNFGTDIALVTIFPQLVCSMYIRVSNGYGALIGTALALVLRVGAGEQFMNFKPFIPYPFYDEELGQIFPVRIFSILVNIITTVIISVIVKLLFEKEVLPKGMDILNNFRKQEKYDISKTMIADQEQYAYEGKYGAVYDNPEVIGETNM